MPSHPLWQPFTEDRYDYRAAKLEPTYGNLAWLANRARIGWSVVYARIYQELEDGLLPLPDPKQITNMIRKWSRSMMDSQRNISDPDQMGIGG